MSLFATRNRQTIRGPINPADKSTVFSIFPKEILEKKPTVQPGIFHIPAGSPEKPVALVVGSSSWWREIDENQPLLEIPNHSLQIAESIVKDYCNGILACDMSETMPGLFFLPGEWSVANAQKEHPEIFKTAVRKQRNWYVALVRMADTLWSRSGANPLTISDDMRLAAKELALKNKDWMQDFSNVNNIACVACGAMRNPLFPICGSCHQVIDKAKAKELGLTA